MYDSNLKTNVRSGEKGSKYLFKHLFWKFICVGFRSFAPKSMNCHHTRLTDKATNDPETQNSK